MDKTLDLDELEQRIKDWAAGMVGFAYPMAIDEALRLISAARVVHWCADVQEVFMEDMEPAYFGFDDPPLLGDFTAAIGKPIIVSAARPAVVSDEVVSTLTKAFWAEYAKSDRGTTAMRAALALLPGGVPDREAIARVICPSAFEPATPGHSVVWYQAPLAEAEELALVKADAIIAMLSASPKGSSLSQPSRTTQEPPSPTPCDLEGEKRLHEMTPEEFAAYSRTLGDA